MKPVGWGANPNNFPAAEKLYWTFSPPYAGFDNQILKYTYDGSLPLSETWNGVINGALQLTYNNDFKVISSNLNGSILNYQYDNDGLLTKVGDLILTRDAQNGLLKETKLGNLTTQRTHSNFAELKEEIAKYSNNELYHVYYTRDKGGRITQKQEIINGISKTFEYRYDMAGRLVEVKLDNSIIETYQYDANGNRLNNNAIYDEQDRLLQYGSNTYTYSQNGDLKTKDNISFNYDVFGNLRSVTSPEKTIDYVIDARNRRIGKKVNGQLVQGFLYSGKLKPIAELDANGNIVARFIYGSKINVPDYIIKGNKTYRVISDHLGSPRLIVDISDGTIAQQIDYDTFGNILSDTNPNFQPFAFAGGLNDNDTSLIRFGARDYDPSIGRWTSKDPILFSGGDSNLFGYVSNDPINAIDPSGLVDWSKRGETPCIFGYCPLDKSGAQVVNNTMHDILLWEDDGGVLYRLLPGEWSDSSIDIDYMINKRNGIIEIIKMRNGSLNIIEGDGNGSCIHTQMTNLPMTIASEILGMIQGLPSTKPISPTDKKHPHMYHRIYGFLNGKYTSEFQSYKESN